MAKAIKHIRAGMLNIEIIGNVPEQSPGCRHRGARSKPTSAAQQFYNHKMSWRELELLIAANFGSKDYFLTFTYDNEHLPENKEEAAACFKKFLRRLRDTRSRRKEDLYYLYVTEGYHGSMEDEYFGADRELEDKRLHHHVLLNSVGPGDLEEYRSLWPYGGYLRAEPVDVHYYQELARYMTKEAREFGRAKPGERTWRGSRNLKKPEVEYIEIPTDSVTLTPPPDAVDYHQFHEKNPYGFADCIGARYLIYAAPLVQMYSYNRSRRSNRPPNNF